MPPRASKSVQRLSIYVYTSEMSRGDQETTRLPPGYRLDLVGDPCVIVLYRQDATVVARFAREADPEEIRRAAEEDRKGGGGAGASIHPIA